MRNSVIILSLVLSFIACDDIIEVVDISNETLTILAPTNNVELTNNDVTFNWNAIEDVDNYRLQIAAPNFENAAQIIEDSTLTGTSLVKTLESGNYEWRVRGQNSAYSTSFIGATFSVNATMPIVDISNESITVTAPDDNATFNTTDTIDFTWEALDGADEYLIEIVTPDFDNPTQTIEDITVTETTFSKNELEAGSYQWRVKAKNTQHETNYTTQSFTVQ